uniref:Uncharacterized protein At5g39865 n=1 Tax=Rhizophora mucronata TaxID=61149 RepID=A0A2P2IMX3_RHIMU
MAELENNTECKGKHKLTSTPTAAMSFFNRSFTMSSTASKPHFQSSSRFYNSFESMKGKVKKLCNLFESSKSLKLITDESQSQSQLQTQTSSLNNKLRSMKSMGPDYIRYPFGFSNCSIQLLGTEDRIVIYFTSLRGVRRTYEDCYAVRMIFRGFRVWVDERDVSMDSAYKKELQSVLGGKNVSLPQVFIRGNYVGGADVIKQMFETGELARLLDSIPRREPGFVCDACGDVRFVPCGNCNGSRKVFDEDEDVLKRCLECNENGLIRCPDCCS